jgi:fatty acid desaturase
MGAVVALAAAVALAFLPALAVSTAYALPLRAAGVARDLGGGAHARRGGNARPRASPHAPLHEGDAARRAVPRIPDWIRADRGVTLGFAWS